MSIELSVESGLLAKGLALLKLTARTVTDHASYQFRVAHEKYCQSVIEKYCKVRTFIVREPPQELAEFYVPASIEVGRKRIERVGVSEILKLSRRAIISGNGGSGKTILMRHLLMDSISSGWGYPVFIELRHLNEKPHAEINLTNIISSTLADHGFPLDKEFATKSLNEGLLVLLLDGFDEVEFSRRQLVSSEIRRIGSHSPSTIIVSSRPDISIQDWHGFATARIAPLNLNEACELIEKIKMHEEEDLKRRFTERLKTGLFNSHKDFLSNPLLLSIMLITYGDSADIPNKFASFYEQAFIALFQRHDALKSGFKRARRTNLDATEFSKAFSAFSAMTYDKRMLSFSEFEAERNANKAIKVSGISTITGKDLLDDAKQAVCLLMDDGLEITYVHRSFQEYFTARFINEADHQIKQRYIDRLASSDQEVGVEVDNVLKLLHEMSPALVEDYFLIPGLSQLFGNQAKRKTSRTSWKRIVSEVIDSVGMHQDVLTFGIKSWPKLRLILFFHEISKFSSRPSRPPANSVMKKHFPGPNQNLPLDTLSNSPDFWDDFAAQPGLFSFSQIEALRIEYQEMVKRAAERKLVASDIFSEV